MPELLFLVAEAPPQAGSPLLRIKISNIADENPIVAFTSVELGQQFIEARRLGSDCRLVPLEKLDPPVVIEARKCRVLLFDSSDILAQHLQPHGRLDYDAYVTSFEDAERRL